MLRWCRPPPHTSRLDEPFERVEQHAVAVLHRTGRADDHRLLVLLRGDDRHALAPAEQAQQDVVRDHVQLLLLLALHVARAGLAEHVLERAQRTLLLMILAEIDIADRIHDSVPVAPWMRDCSASRWLWMVTIGLEWSRVRSGSADMADSPSAGDKL